MKLRQLALLILCISTSHAFAQNKNFTMQEAVLGLSSTLAPTNLKQLQWQNNNSYVHTVAADNNEAIVRTTLPSSKVDTLTDLQDINTAMKMMQYEPLKKMPALQWLENDKATFNVGSSYYLLTMQNGNPTIGLMYTLPDDADNLNMHPKTQAMAYTSNYNLFVVKPNALPIQITNDGTENLLYGTSVHRDEFGINGGIFWNASGSWLAFYQMNQAMVTDYPIINWAAVPATVKNIKYPFAGNKSHQVSLYTYNFSSGKKTRVKTADSSEQYLTCVSWHPTEPNVYIGLLNRKQNFLQLNKYDATDGKFVRTLLEEQSSKYVEPQHSMYFVPNRPNYFVWWSQKTGYMHLYLVDENTNKQKPITEGKWIVNDILGYNENTSELIVAATYDSPLEKNIYAADIFDKTLRKLNKINGTHNATCTADGAYVLDAFSNATTPRAIDVLGVNGDFEKRVLTAKNTLTDYAVAKVQKVTLYADDSTKLYGKLMLPANFDANKKYPVIVYLYGGPHAQMITNRFPESGNLWYDLLTQKGYVVFSMDNRGSSNRGYNFESATHRNLGTIEIQDQLKGVQFLKTLPYVDTARMGVHGWSFGGFITTSFMLREPSVFKAAVAGGPVMDWSKYEIMYTERYMGTPQDNAEGYANNLLLTKTKNLKGKLLVIHGTDDNTVTWQHSNAFLKACVDNGVQCDYFVYPTHEHNVRGKDRVHLMQKITDYFDLWLKP
jgi:dipeptidyl-peptidase 4